MNYKKKEQQKIKAQIEKINRENYLFSSSDDSNTEEIDNKLKSNVNKQQNKYSTTTTTTTKIIKDEEKEIQESESTDKKAQQNVLDKMFNSDVLFSSENIENIDLEKNSNKI